jgi:hypothetical protein
LKKLVGLSAALGLVVCALPARAAEADKKDDKKVEVKKKAEDEGRFSFPVAVWQAWGYQRENPLVATSFYFMPSFKITDRQRIGAFVGMTAEYTQPDDGRRMYWSNTFVTYTYDAWKPKVGKHEFTLSAGGQMVLPTDEAAWRLGTMRIALGPLMRLSWKYGALSLSYRVSFLKYFNESTTQQITRDTSPFNGLDVQGPPVESTGKATVNFQVLHVAALGLKITKKLYFDSQIWIFNQTPYRFSGGDEFTSPNAVPGANRDSYWAFGEIGYQFNKLFSLGFGFSLSANQLSPNSKFPYIPVDNYNNNFMSYVAATFSPTF